MTAEPSGPGRHLFLDPGWLAQRENVALAVQPPRREEIDFPPRAAWERMRGLYVTVLDDTGRLRMWYGARSAMGQEHKYTCYAESDDGVTWRSPALGQVETEGTADTPIVHAGGMEGSVFVDPTAPPAQRYRGLWNVFGQGLFLHSSPDGLAWTRADQPLLRFEFDTQNVAFYDRRLGRYVGYVRAWHNGPPSRRRRKVARFEADRLDGPLGVDPVAPHPAPDRLPHVTVELPLVMACDERDPPDTDVYTNAVTPYPLDEAWYCAFPVLYRHFAEPDEPPFRNDGRTEAHFMGSPDGVTWHRYDRAAYAAPAPDERMLYMGRGVIHRGGELWQYGVAYRTSHGQGERRMAEPDGRIVRFVQRVDGFVAAHAPGRGGRLLTGPLEVTGRHLRLNLDTGGIGEVRVGVLDEAGRPLPGLSTAQANPLLDNATDRLAAWAARSDLSALIGRRVRLELHMEYARLYSLRFTEPPDDGA